MGGENTDKAFEQALVLFPEGTPNRWQKVADHVNGREQCQLNLQVLWPPMALSSTVRPRQPPMHKIRSPSYRPMFGTITPGRWAVRPRQPPMHKIRSPSYRPMFGTITPGRWVHRKKQVPRNRRRGVQFKRWKVHTIYGELHAELERIFSMSWYTPSGATNKYDIEELSSRISQINITTLV